MVKAANATALLVSWDALKTLYLTHYTIYYSAFLNKVVHNFTKVVPSTKTSEIVNIRELRTGVEHEFEVTASLEIDGEVYEGVKSVPAKMVFGKHKLWNYVYLTTYHSHAHSNSLVGISPLIQCHVL